MTFQFVENHFADSYHPTIENTVNKVIKYRDQEFVVEIIDTAGQVSAALTLDQGNLSHTKPIPASALIRTSFRI